MKKMVMILLVCFVAPVHAGGVLGKNGSKKVATGAGVLVVAGTAAYLGKRVYNNRKAKAKSSNTQAAPTHADSASLTGSAANETKQPETAGK